MVRFGKPRQGSKEVDNGADLVTDASAGLGCQELVETETAVEEERGAPIKTDDSADLVTDAPVEWRFQKAVEQEQAAMESDCCAAGRDASLEIDNSGDLVTDAPVDLGFQELVVEQEAAVEQKSGATSRDCLTASVPVTHEPQASEELEGAQWSAGSAEYAVPAGAANHSAPTETWNDIDRIAV